MTTKSASGRAKKGNSKKIKTPIPGLDLGQLDEALGFRLRVLDQVITRNFSRHMASLGLTPTLYSILVLVAANPLTRQSDLALTLGMRQPNLVERVSLLMKRGLIVRRESPSDLRVNALELSVAGRLFMNKVNIAHAAHLADLQTLLGRDTYEKLLALMPLSKR